MWGGGVGREVEGEREREHILITAHSLPHSPRSPHAAAADHLATRIYQPPLSLHDADQGLASTSLPRDTIPSGLPTLVGYGRCHTASISNNRSLTTDRLTPNRQQQQQQWQQRRLSGQAGSSRLSRGAGGGGGSRERLLMLEGIRGLSDTDITFLRSKLVRRREGGREGGNA